MLRRPLRFATRALLLQVGVLLLVGSAGLVLMGFLLHDNLTDQYEQRALAIARAVAADPDVARAVTVGKPGGELQVRAEAVRLRTGALFVVIADVRGIRYSHPNPSNIGKPVSTDPSEALAGREIVSVERGTLGLSARGKVPLRDDRGGVVGQVSVGLSANEVNERLWALLPTAAVLLGLALLVGAAGAALLARRLRRQTLGLEPTDLANLLREQEAVVHGVQDGVLAVDPAGRITACNETACQLLGVPLAPRDWVGNALLPERLRDVVESRRPVRGLLVLAGDRVLAVTSHPVDRDGRDLGLVITLRDRTDLDELGRELDAVRALSDALRAQSHEYTNRLHTIAGLLQIGHADEASSYLCELTADPLATENGATVRLTDPYLRGLLAAKTAAASERGVRLALAADAELRAPLTAPLDVVTVVGNLVDNAVEAARSGQRRPAWVEISVVGAGDSLHVAVTDSGDGVPETVRDRVFDDGFTTSADTGRPHGIGLALARQVARSHGGDIELLRTAGTDHGAVFASHLNGVVEISARPTLEGIP